MTYQLYTDGAAFPQRKQSGWAYILQQGDTEFKGRGKFSGCHSNRAEMLALVHGLRKVPVGATVTVYTDSTYVLTVHKWVLAKAAAEIRAGLWWTYKQLIECRTVALVKVDGRHPLNERAHLLARSAVRGEEPADVSV